MHWFSEQYDPAPFSLKLSLNNSLNKCSLNSLTSEQKHQMFLCFRDCFNDPYCRSVNLTNCDKSNVVNEEFDFVKEDINA